jgi:chemotaxis protein MotB
MIGMLLRGNNRDRWLLSYADFITVLFAAFVLMYAAARAREGAGLSTHGPAQNAPPPESNLLTDLRNSLNLERQSGLVTVSVDQRGIVIALDDKLCFQPGEAEVQPAAVGMFTKVAAILSRHTNRILLEGHTDSVPIHNAQFRSNWELSTARSIAVMELMERSAGIAGQRFLIGGSADNAPVSTNETEQGRAHNRRVEIVVLDGRPNGGSNYRTN